MKNELETIASKEYIGRMIIIGKIGDDEVIAYAVTGRSPSSQAREMVFNKELDAQAIKTNPTDPEALKTGIEPLLIYNCIRRHNGNFVVSNGAQTDLIIDKIDTFRVQTGTVTSAGVLVETLREPYIVKGNDKIKEIDLTKYEPDEPNYTRRISGILTTQGAAMHIVKNIEGQTINSFFEVPLIDGRGKVISTYTGQNVPSGEVIPSFTGEPFDVTLKGKSPKEVAEAVYDALGPKNPGEGIVSPGQDFRVGVAAMFYNRKSNTAGSYIINRHKRGK